VQFEITESTRTALVDWISLSGLASDDFLFPSRVHASPHLSIRQYARIVDSWVEEIGLDPTAYGTHSIRRTKQHEQSAFEINRTTSSRDQTPN
jgi:hypothetical protein